MVLVLFVPITALFLTLLFLLLLLVARGRSKQRRLPPGPRSWPVVGNLLYLAPLERRLRQPTHAVLAAVAGTYGPLVHLRLGARSVIVASSPSTAMEILKKRDKMLSGRYIPATFRISVYTAYSLVWAARSDSHWRWLRTLCRTEIFSSSRLEAHSALREEKTKEMVELLLRRQGEEIKIGELAFRTVFNMLGCMIFSTDLLPAVDEEEGSGKSDKSLELKKAMSRGLQLGIRPNLEDFYPAVFGGLDLQGLRRETKRNLDIVYDIFDGVIRERRAKLGADAGGQVGDRKADSLNVLLDAGCDDTQLKALFMDLFTAGTDASATLVEWTMSELVKNPHSMKLVREELKRVVGSPEGSATAVRESHLPHLLYLQACVKETLRLHPPVPMLLHCAVDACEVTGYEVPTDCTVLVNVWAIGRDPEVWEYPLQFRPERFLMENGAPDFRGLDFGFLPFGAGRRICPGLPLVTHVLPLVVASMVHGFEWRLPGGMVADQLGMNERLGLVLEREQPLVMIPTSVAQHSCG